MRIESARWLYSLGNVMQVETTWDVDLGLCYGVIRLDEDGYDFESLYYYGDDGKICRSKTIEEILDPAGTGTIYWGNDA